MKLMSQRHIFGSYLQIVDTEVTDRDVTSFTYRINGISVCVSERQGLRNQSRPLSLITVITPKFQIIY